jgi:hypothetical protein
VRALLYAAAIAAGATILGSSQAGVLATTAGVLFESTPFLLAAIAARSAFGCRGDWIAYLGCGCGSGSSARSLPATAATWLVFGPAVALARFAGAVVATQLLRRRHFWRNRDVCRANHGEDEGASSLLSLLDGVLPGALLAGILTQGLSRFDLAQAGPIVNALCGLLLGLAAPCGVGSVAVAGALHARAPVAAIAYLCVAGIVGPPRVARGTFRNAHDALSYAVLATSLGLVAFRHGDALVHPKFALSLWSCAAAAVALTLCHRRRQALFLAPAVMLLGALASAPAPSYRATETSLADLFPGERVIFTGRLTRDGRHDAIVRYAITCCRADAAPIVLRLARPLPLPAGTWLRAEGFVSESGGELALTPHAFAAIEPPTDPFVYR